MLRYLPIIVLLAACSGNPAELPDGGRPRQQCTNTGTKIVVAARDIMGQPLPGAEVTARNATNGMVQTSLTGGDGRTFFTDDLGNGQVEVSATVGALKTKQPFIVQLLCGDCDCTAMPGSAALTLQ